MTPKTSPSTRRCLAGRPCVTPIHHDVCAHGFDSRKGSFVQSYGSRLLDASLLLLPTTGFLPVTDPRIRGTIEAVERELLVDGFVLRYDSANTDDGLPAGEGAFLACSFWLADAYAMLGRLDDARRLFERLLAIRNDVGLLAEEYDTEGKRLVGNFPQAFCTLRSSRRRIIWGARPSRPSSGLTAERKRASAAVRKRACPINYLRRQTCISTYHALSPLVINGAGPFSFSLFRPFFFPRRPAAFRRPFFPACARPVVRFRSPMRAIPVFTVLLAFAATAGLNAQGRPRAVVNPAVETDGVHAGTATRVALTVTLPSGCTCNPTRRAIRRSSRPC